MSCNKGMGGKIKREWKRKIVSESGARESCAKKGHGKKKWKETSNCDVGGNVAWCRVSRFERGLFLRSFLLFLYSHFSSLPLSLLLRWHVFSKFFSRFFFVFLFHTRRVTTCFYQLWHLKLWHRFESQARPPKSAFFHLFGSVLWHRFFSNEIPRLGFQFARDCRTEDEKEWVTKRREWSSFFQLGHKTALAFRLLTGASKWVVRSDQWFYFYYFEENVCWSIIKYFCHYFLVGSFFVDKWIPILRFFFMK